MPQLSEDERYKQEYYVLRAYEGGFPAVGGKLRGSSGTAVGGGKHQLTKVGGQKTARPTASTTRSATSARVVEPPFTPHLDPRPPPPPFLSPPPLSPSQQINMSNSTSQGAGPDSVDMAAFVKQREDQKRSLEQRLLERRCNILQKSTSSNSGRR